MANTIPTISSIVPYTKRLDDTENGLYIGEALPGSLETASVWRIQRLVESGPTIVIKWANGNSNFVNAWSDRTTLPYS